MEFKKIELKKNFLRGGILYKTGIISLPVKFADEAIKKGIAEEVKNSKKENK